MGRSRGVGGRAAGRTLAVALVLAIAAAACGGDDGDTSEAAVS